MAIWKGNQGPGGKFKADLDESIRQTLGESLEEIGGPSVRDSVLYYLREKYRVDLAKVSSNPATLTRALSDIFGIGENLIERKMVTKLSSRLKLEGGSKSLTEVIKEARAASAEA